MTALVNTSDLWQSCQMVGPSTGPCRMTSGPARKRSPRPLGETTSKAGTGEPVAQARTRKGAGFFVCVSLTKAQSLTRSQNSNKTKISSNKIASVSR